MLVKDDLTFGTPKTTLNALLVMQNALHDPMPLLVKFYAELTKGHTDLALPEALLNLKPTLESISKQKNAPLRANRATLQTHKVLFYINN